MLFADGDDLVGQRADLFVEHVFFDHEDSLLAVHRQAGRWIVKSDEGRQTS